MLKLVVLCPNRLLYAQHRLLDLAVAYARTPGLVQHHRADANANSYSISNLYNVHTHQPFRCTTPPTRWTRIQRDMDQGNLNLCST